MASTPRTRNFNQTQTSVGAKDHVQWDSLMRKVMARAEKIGDRRLQGLRGSISKGESMSRLKKMGIISEADILREFPDPTK